MFNYEYRSTTDAGRVCLELSLKPFGYDKSLEGIEKVCRDYYKKWAALLEYASGCSVLLWTSDGSEIFEFTGDLDMPFEWCKYIGIGNWDRSIKGEEAKKARSLHQLPIYYMENPPEMTYRDLKNIIDTLKRVGKEMTGFDIQVGETFDPGPEFAYSAFKYERHPEIAKGDIMGKNQWLHCAARLHAEKRAYAAYPDGIPESTHIGEFLGRQFMALKRLSASITCGCPTALAFRLRRGTGSASCSTAKNSIFREQNASVKPLPNSGTISTPRSAIPSSKRAAATCQPAWTLPHTAARSMSSTSRISLRLPIRLGRLWTIGSVLSFPAL